MKEDVLAILRPMTKVLQDSKLIAPTLISVCSNSIRTLKKLKSLVDSEMGEAFMRKELFPKAASLLEKLTAETTDVIPNRQTRHTEETSNKYVLYHDYLLVGGIEEALQNVAEDFAVILLKLVERLQHRLESIVEDPVIKAMAIFLHTKMYPISQFDDLYEEVKVIVERFSQLLVANGCQLEVLESELDMLFEHVNLFLSNKPSEKVWPHLFLSKRELGIVNILHVAELALAMPLSNAESERVFSFLWRVFNKERQSLENKTLETILRLRCDDEYSPERYTHAIQLFLTEHPDGTLRKGERRVDGITPVPKKKHKNNDGVSVSIILDQLVSSSDDENIDCIEDIPLNTISDNEWSDSEEEI